MNENPTVNLIQRNMIAADFASLLQHSLPTLSVRSMIALFLLQFGVPGLLLTGGVLLRLVAVVEFRELDRVHLDEFTELEVQNDLLIGIGFASEAGVTDQQIGPGKGTVLVFGVAGRLVQHVGKVDVFRGAAGRPRLRLLGLRLSCGVRHRVVCVMEC